MEDLIAELQDNDDDDVHLNEEELAELQKFRWKKALGHGLKYAAGLFGKKQDEDNDDLSNIEAIFAELQDDYDRSDDHEDLAKLKMMNLKKALKHGLKYFQRMLLRKEKQKEQEKEQVQPDEKQNEGENNNSEGNNNKLAKVKDIILAQLQDDENEDDINKTVEKKELAKLQGLLKKALGRGLKYASSLFAKRFERKSLAQELIDKVSRK